MARKRISKETASRRTRAWLAANPLAAWLAKKGLSPKDVYEPLAIDRQVVDNWLSGWSRPNLRRHLPELARLMGLDPWALHLRWEKWVEEMPEES